MALKNTSVQGSHASAGLVPGACRQPPSCEALWAGPGGHQRCCVESPTASPKRTGPVHLNSCFPSSSWLPRRFFGCCLLNARENRMYLNPPEGPQVPIGRQDWSSFLGSGDKHPPACPPSLCKPLGRAAPESHRVCQKEARARGPQGPWELCSKANTS